MLSEDGIVKKFEGFIMGILSSLSAPLLEEMINRDVMPFIWDYKLPPFLSGIKNKIIENRKFILDNINMGNVKKYCMEYRPDLISVVSTERGYKWMERLLKQIRFVVENIELDNYQLKQKFLSIIRMRMEQQEYYPPPSQVRETPVKREETIPEAKRETRIPAPVESEEDKDRREIVYY